MTPGLSASVCQTLREGVDKIDKGYWEKCIKSVEEKEVQYFNRDNFNEVFVINLVSGDDESSSSDE